MSTLLKVILTIPTICAVLFLYLYKRKVNHIRNKQSCIELSPYITSTVSYLIDKKTTKIACDNLCILPRLIVDKITSNMLQKSGVDPSNPQLWSVNHASLSRVFLTGIVNDEFRIFVPTEVPFINSMQETFDRWISGIKHDFLGGKLFYPNNLIFVFKNFPRIINYRGLTNMMVVANDHVLYKINTILFVDANTGDYKYFCWYTGSEIAKGDAKYLCFAILGRA